MNFSRALFSLTALSLGGPACSHEDRQQPERLVIGPEPTISRPPPTWPVLSEGIRKVRTEINGNPRIGSVLFIRQFHSAAAEFLENNPSRQEFSRTALTSKFVGSYQFEILRLLEELRPLHIFSEGLDETISPGSMEPALTRQLSPEDLRHVKMRFLLDFPRSPDDVELDMLSVLGAHQVYALRHRDVFLHKTLTREEGNLEIEAAKKLGRRDPSALEIFFRREGWTMREINDFLGRHPGERVVLIYGLAHDFCDDFLKMKSPPELRSVWWDIPNPAFPVPQPPHCETLRKSSGD